MTEQNTFWFASGSTRIQDHGVGCLIEARRHRAVIQQKVQRRIDNRISVDSYTGEGILNISVLNGASNRI